MRVQSTSRVQRPIVASAFYGTMDMHYESIRTVYSLKLESILSFVPIVRNTLRGISLRSCNSNHCAVYETDTIGEGLALVMNSLCIPFRI